MPFSAQNIVEHAHQFPLRSGKYTIFTEYGEGSALPPISTNSYDSREIFISNITDEDALKKLLETCESHVRPLRLYIREPVVFYRNQKSHLDRYRKRRSKSIWISGLYKFACCPLRSTPTREDGQSTSLRSEDGTTQTAFTCRMPTKEVKINSAIERPLKHGQERGC